MNNKLKKLYNLFLINLSISILTVGAGTIFLSYIFGYEPDTIFILTYIIVISVGLTIKDNKYSNFLKIKLK